MLGIRQVDFETHFVSLRNEPNHAPAPRELGNVAHRQDTRLVERRQDLFEPIFLGRADEQNAATFRVLRLCDALDDHLLAVDALSGDGGIETRAERILTEHTNAEDVARRSDSRGPFNESAKVI